MLGKNVPPPSQEVRTIYLDELRWKFESPLKTIFWAQKQQSYRLSLGIPFMRGARLDVQADGKYAVSFTAEDTHAKLFDIILSELFDSVHGIDQEKSWIIQERKGEGSWGTITRKSTKSRYRIEGVVHEGDIFPVSQILFLLGSRCFPEAGKVASKSIGFSSWNMIAKSWRIPKPELIPPSKLEVPGRTRKVSQDVYDTLSNRNSPFQDNGSLTNYEAYVVIQSIRSRFRRSEGPMDDSYRRGRDRNEQLILDNTMFEDYGRTMEQRFPLGVCLYILNNQEEWDMFEIVLWNTGIDPKNKGANKYGCSIFILEVWKNSWSGKQISLNFSVAPNRIDQLRKDLSKSYSSGRALFWNVDINSVVWGEDEKSSPQESNINIELSVPVNNPGILRKFLLFTGCALHAAGYEIRWPIEILPTYDNQFNHLGRLASDSIPPPRLLPPELR